MQENTKQSESYKSQNSTEQNNNSVSGEIKINRSNIEQLENTIFNIASDPDRGWFLTIGHNIITEPKPTQWEAIAELENQKWDIIMKLILIVIDHELEKIKQ